MLDSLIVPQCKKRIVGKKENKNLNGYDMRWDLAQDEGKPNAQGSRHCEAWEGSNVCSLSPASREAVSAT